MQVEFEVVKEIGKLSSSARAPELNVVRWNGQDAKYDIRRWSEEGVPRKGITIEMDSINTFLKILKEALTNNYNCEAIAKFDSQLRHAEIYNSFGVFETSGKFHKQITYIDWGYGGKFDLRGWTENYDKCSKGISLTKFEMEQLKILLENELTYLKQMKDISEIALKDICLDDELLI